MCVKCRLLVKCRRLHCVIESYLYLSQIFIIVQQKVIFMSIFFVLK